MLEFDISRLVLTYWRLAPEVHDSNLPIELSQHLFDIQMGKYMLKLDDVLLSYEFLLSSVPGKAPNWRFPKCE